MDFFELLQNDSQLTPNIIAEISFFQQTFANFSNVIDSLLNDQNYQSISSESIRKSLKTSPQTPIIAPYLFSYYLERLDVAMFTFFLAKAKSLLAIKPTNYRLYLEFLREIYQSNRSLINDFTEIWGSELTNSLENTLKERFQVLFIKEIAFQEVLRDIFSQELLGFQIKMLGVFNGKLEEFFLNKVQAFLSKNNPSNPSNNDPKLFELISLFCLEFNFKESLENLLLKLLTDNLCSFMKTEVSQGLDFENNELLNTSVQYTQIFLNTFLQNLGNLLTKSPIFNEMLQNLSQKLEFSISEHFFLICKEKLFDMILAYPETAKLIFDLKSAISINSNFLFDLSDSLLISINKRLLIPGVITQNILNQYINILKVLQLLDKGLIFSKVTNPIKSYLLKRPDTLRCIIAHLTEDSENYTKLVKEYVKIPSKEEQQYELSSDEDENQAEKWEILPLLSKKNNLIRVKYQESDLVSVLVNLYGSQEAFINEYQIMLAEKLLGTKEFNIEEEIKNIELLKLRFGENNLQNCNIIVKDVKESKRIDQNLHANFDNNPNKTNLRFINNDSLSFEKLHTMFASKGYWPINYDSEQKLKLPVGFLNIFEDYSLKFSKIKAMRKLIWHNQLGFVNLSLTFDNGEFDFKCLPIHAILISYFDETSKFI